MYREGELYYHEQRMVTNEYTLFTGLVLGFGFTLRRMCGPIVLALPVKCLFSRFLGLRISYNLGRISVTVGWACS